MDLIKRLFGSQSRPDLGTPSQIDGRPEGAAMEGDSQAGKRRELVRVLARDTLRVSGIPESWVESHIMLELGRDGQPLIHLRLVVKHWNERLLKYAVAFQRRLMAEIVQFEPNAHLWLLSITWQYDVGTQCPYLDMPDPDSWDAPARPAAPAPAAAAAPPPVAPPPVAPPRDELQEDLARLYAVRDANLAAPQPDSAPRPQKPGAPIVPDVII